MTKIMTMAVISALFLSPQAMAAQAVGTDSTNATQQDALAPDARDKFNVQVPDRTMDLVIPTMATGDNAGDVQRARTAGRENNVQVPAETMAAVMPQMTGSTTIAARLAQADEPETGVTETAG